MDALIATDANQIGVTAAFAGILPAPVENATADASAFLNLINVLMNVLEAPAIPTVSAASPKRCASDSGLGDIPLQSNAFADDTRTALRPLATPSSNVPEAAGTPPSKQKRDSDQKAPAAFPVLPPPSFVPVLDSTVPEQPPEQTGPQPAPPEQGPNAIASTGTTAVATQTIPVPAAAESAARPEIAFEAVLTRIAAEPASPAEPPRPEAADATPQLTPQVSKPIIADSVPLAAPEERPPQPREQALQPVPVEAKNKPAFQDREDTNARGAASVGSVSLADLASARVPQTAVQPAGFTIETPRQTPADIIRNSEPFQPAVALQPRGTSAQEFAVRIAQPNVPVVDLHVAERNGQVQVAVRTPDAGLQTSLRQDLGTLVSSLQRAGYHTETFIPHTTPTQGSSMTEASSQSDSQDSHAGSRGGSGEWTGGRQQQQRQRGQNPQAWLEELENQR